MPTLKKIKAKSSHGSALVFSLIILSIILVSALAIGAASVIDRKNSLTGNSSTQSFQAADSGIEMMIQAIKGKSGAFRGINIGSASCNSNTYLVDTGKGSSQITMYDVNNTQLDCNADISKLDHVKSVGIYKNTSRAVSVVMAAGVIIYQCPEGLTAGYGAGGGQWEFVGCQGQISSIDHCTNVVYQGNGSPSDVRACVKLGTITVN